MVSQTNEAALESHIENALAKDGYRVGDPADFDRWFRLLLRLLEPKQLKLFDLDTRYLTGFLIENNRQKIGRN